MPTNPTKLNRVATGGKGAASGQNRMLRTHRALLSEWAQIQGQIDPVAQRNQDNQSAKGKRANAWAGSIW